MTTRSKGRPPKYPVPEELKGKMTQSDIVRRYRARMKETGKAQVSYWLDVELIERIKDEAVKSGRPTSELVEDVLSREFRGSGKGQEE